MYIEKGGERGEEGCGERGKGGREGGWLLRTPRAEWAVSLLLGYFFVKGQGSLGG